MKKNIEKIIIVLIFLLIFIVCIIVGILSLNRENINEIINSEIGDAGEEVIFDTQKIEDVTDSKDFFTVEQCINSYLNELNSNNSMYYGRDDDNNYVQIISDEEINKNRYNLLSKSYVEKRY